MDNVISICPGPPGQLWTQASRPSLPLTTPTDSHGHTHSPITLASITGWGPRGGPGRGSFVTLSLCGDNAIIKGRTGVTWLERGSTGVETRLPGTTCGALPPTQVSNKQHRLPAPFPNAHCGPSRLRPIQPPERVMTSHKLRIYSSPHSPPRLPFPSLLIPSFFSLHPSLLLHLSPSLSLCLSHSPTHPDSEPY